MNEIVGIVASKYNGTLNGEEIILNIGANANSTVSMSINNNEVFYLMDFSYLATTSDVRCTIRDESTNTIYSAIEIPDTNTIVKYYPFLKQGFKNKITVLLENNSGVTTTVTFTLHGIRIPFNNYLDFENHLYKLAGFKDDREGRNC